MELISVIVPVYNVAQYLIPCITSILNQNYENIEIILVNDGSTDSSGKICEEFRLKDSRIRIVQKTNGGLSSARNAGLEIAGGDYISFVDGDDYIEQSMISDMYQYIKEMNADIVEVDFSIVKDNYYKKKKNRKFQIVLDKEAALKEFFKGNKIENSVCNKLYRKSVIEGIRFIEGKTSEDFPFNFEVIQNANRVYINKYRSYYNYVIRDNSIVNSGISSNFFDNINNFSYIEDRVEEDFKDYVEAKLIREKIKTVRRLLSHDINRTYKTERVKYISDIRNYSIGSALKYLGLRQIVSLYLMKASPILYEKIYRLFQKQ